MSDSSEVNKPVDQQPVALVPAPDRPLAPIEPFDALRSTTRLLVGLALIGGDELLKRLQMLEHDFDALPPNPEEMAARIRTSPTISVTRSSAWRSSCRIKCACKRRVCSPRPIRLSAM
jgi:hypothetical protein